MRIAHSPLHLEAEPWQSLPENVRRALDRQDLLQELDARQEKFNQFVEQQLVDQQLVEQQFEHQTARAPFEIGSVGDWHCGRRSMVLHRDASWVVIKVRDPGVTREVSRWLDLLTEELPLRLTMPSIKPVGKIWIQEYVETRSARRGSVEDLGALAALATWLGMIDLHADNLLPGPDSIALIDVECAFHTTSEVANPLLVSGLLENADPNPHFYPGGCQRFSLAAPEHSAATFSKALDILRDAHTPELYARIDDLPCRRILRSTEIYISFLQRRFLIGWNEATTRHEWRQVVSKNPIAEEIKEAELQALLAWDVPCFWQVGERLISCGDTDVASGWPLLSQGLRRLHRHLNSPSQRQKLAADLLRSLRIEQAGVRVLQ